MKIFVKKIFAFILALWGIASASEVDAQNFLPKKPSIERLRQDLVGRKMSQVSDSYFPSDWYLDIIKESEIERIKILSSRFDGRELLYKLEVFVKDENVLYKVTADFSYYLTDKFRWKADYLNTKDIVIVSSGRYNSCISSRIIGWSGEYQLELRNSSDVKLIVGGVVRYEYGNGTWKRFSALVEGHGTVTVGGLFFGSISDYKIHFIERY